MMAPVYRHIETQSRFLGLGFPSEFLILLVVLWVGILVLPLGAVALSSGLTWLGLFLLGQKTPPLFLQHAGGRLARSLRSAGVLSAGVRHTHAPAFPFGPYLERDGAVTNVNLSPLPATVIANSPAGSP